MDYVVPIAVDERNTRLQRFYSWFEIQENLLEAVQEIRAKLESLTNLEFTGDDNKPLPNDPSILDTTHSIVLELIYAGEELLLYHKRLAKSNASYKFLGSHDMYDHWEHYSATRRIFKETDKLVKGSWELLEGYQNRIREDDKFLLYELELPRDLEDDFVLARNLFSVGFDDVGVLITGRGLEGVLRRIAKLRKINITAKGKPTLVSQADIFDLIETMSRVKWKVTGIPLITKDTKALLHYLRTLRNEGAHSGIEKRRATLNPREIATIVTETANQLWKDITNSRARLDPITIIKDW